MKRIKEKEMNKAILSVVMLIFSFPVSAGIFDGFLSKSPTEKLLDELEAIAKESNKSLPIMLDKETRYDADIAGPGLMLNSFFTLVNRQKSEVDAKEFVLAVKPYVLKKMCTLPDVMKAFNHGITFRRTYFSTRGEFVANFDITFADCANKTN